MKLRLPVCLMRAVPAGARAAAHATLASGFLCMGAVFFSFSAYGQGDPIAILVEEDDELAVPVEDEAADELTLTEASGAAAEQDVSQAAALAESEQEHAAELGINATSSTVSQAAITAQDIAVSPAQAAGSGRADSAVAVISSELPSAAAEGGCRPLPLRKGSFALIEIPSIKTTSSAILLREAVSLSRTEWSDASSAFSDEATLHSGAVGTFSGGSAACSACGFAGASVSCGGVGSSFGCSPASAEATSSTGSLSSDESELTLTEPAASDEADSILPEDTDPVDTSLPDDTTASASSSVSLLSSSSYTFVSPRARTFSLKMLGSTATSLIETQSSMPIYGWNGSEPTKDERAIAYTTVPGTVEGLLSPTNNASYTLSKKLTGLNADGFDVKLFTGGDTTIRSIDIASSGNWVAGSVWLSQGIFNVVNLPEGSVGALYAINSRLHINKDENGVIGSVTIKPETLFIGGRSCGGNNSAYALNDATLSAAMDCEVGGGRQGLE